MYEKLCNACPNQCKYAGTGTGLALERECPVIKGYVTSWNEAQPYEGSPDYKGWVECRECGCGCHIEIPAGQKDPSDEVVKTWCPCGLTPKWVPVGSKAVEKEEKKGDDELAELGGMTKAIVAAVVKEMLDENSDEVATTVTTAVEKALTEKYGEIPRTVIEVKGVEMKPVKKVAGIMHSKFPDVLSLVCMDMPVFLTGPAGSGKNHLVKQVADTLGKEFYFSNAIQDEYKLTGFIDAGGVYHETQFYKAFTEGGLFFFDEVDASIPEVLVLMNAAIENKYMNFPTGRFDAHPDFRVVAAGNTYGTGADVLYVGRNQLDAATLDRFVMVEINYDKEVEKIMAEGDTKLVRFVHEYRKALKDSGINKVVSYRAIRQIATMTTKTGIKPSDAIRYTLLKGLSSDDLKMVKRKAPHGDGYPGHLQVAIDEVLSAS